MGLVSGETGRGTFVKETALPPGHGIDIPPAALGSVDLSFNVPTLPSQAELLRTALRQLALTGDLEALLRYQPRRPPATAPPWPSTCVHAACRSAVSRWCWWMAPSTA
jgi:hypothetical protein